MGEAVRHGDGLSTFDPMSDLLAEQGARPKSLQPVDLRQLSAYERALLVIDGTVTKFIEAYMLEPVMVTLLGQEAQRLTQEAHWLEAPEGTEVLSRQVVLRGKYSNSIYVYAASLLVQARLPEFVRQRLEVDPHGIGHILLESRLETFREVLWYGREKLEPAPEALAQLSGQEVISRSYRIFAGGQPLMLISEKFPPRPAGEPD